MERVTLEQEWWQDAQGKPVLFGDPAGVSVLYGLGALVPASVAQSLAELGISAKSIESAEVEDKAISAPAASKAVRSRGAKK